MNYNKDLNLNDLLPDHWKSFINEEILKETTDILKKEIIKCQEKCYEIYPFKEDNIFKIFNLTRLENIKVVILGQDPYHANKYQANGIAFSVNPGVSIPPSLRNIFKELYTNYDLTKKNNGDLSYIVEQGVFMLNASLTVQQKNPNSHSIIWENFTNHIIDVISKNCNFVIFVAWGSYALDKLKNIDTNKHILFTSSHPSPLSCYKTDKPFIGSNIFLKINNILKKNNIKQINW